MLDFGVAKNGLLSIWSHSHLSTLVLVVQLPTYLRDSMNLEELDEFRGIRLIWRNSINLEGFDEF